MEWISVEDKLPELDEIVIGYVKSSPFSPWRVLPVRRLKSGYENVWLREYVTKISHWCKLPAPPEG